MNDEPKLHETWPMSFDEDQGVWNISGNEDGATFPIAQIRCQFDDHNGRRRHAAHLMANAHKMYSYIQRMGFRGDDVAMALVDSIQIGMASDAEERVMQSPSFNPQ